MWIGVIISCSLLLFFFLLIGREWKVGSVFEWLSIFWFRLACAFLLLFVLNVIGGFIGFEIPLNFFSALTIAVLGFPGVLSVGVINFFL